MSVTPPRKPNLPAVRPSGALDPRGEKEREERHLAWLKQAGVVMSGSDMTHLIMTTASGVPVNVPVWIRSPALAHIDQGLRTDFHQHVMTIAEALRAVPDLMTRRHVSGDRFEETALAVSRPQVRQEHGADFFQVVKERGGIEGLERKLMAKLVALADFRTGLKMMDAQLRARAPERLAAHALSQVTTLEHLNRVFPEITAYELSVIALLRNVPATWLRRPEGAVAMLRDLTAAGAVFGSDDVFLSSTEDFDPEFLASGELLSEELVPYGKQPLKLLRDLMSHRLQDSMLFERALERHNPALGRGVLMLKEVEGCFNPNFRIEYLPKASVLDDEVFVRMIGLLDHVPALLLQEEPFVGFISPFGAALKFIDSRGRLQDVVPYHGLVAHITHEDTYHLKERDLTSNNPLMVGLMKDLRHQLEQHLVEALPVQSRVEELGNLGLERFRLSLPAGARKDFVLSDGPLGVLAGVYTVGNVERGLKMGPEELEDVLGVLSRLPPELMQRVFPDLIIQVVKHHRGLAALPLVGGGSFAQLIPSGRSLHIDVCPGFTGPFGHLSVPERQLYRDDVLEQIGVALWSALGLPETTSWLGLSGWLPVPDPPPGEPLFKHQVAASHQPRVFLTERARTDAEKDFSDHLVAFLHHGDEFRRRAGSETGQIFRMKYDYFKQLCRGEEHEQRSPISLEQVGETRRGLAQKIERNVEHRYAVKVDSLAKARKTPRIPVSLPSQWMRAHLAGRTALSFRGNGVSELLGELVNTHRSLEPLVFNSSWELQPNVRVYLSGLDETKGWRTCAVDTGDKLEIRLAY